MSDLDVSRRFGGIDRLYGEGALARLSRAHACVIGIGGVGSWAVEALARSGIGFLTLIDLDHVAESNINRQIQALDATLGAAKVLAMKERIAQINSVCVVNMVEDFIEADNIATLLPACDAVIDAIDNVRAKAALLAHCRRHKQFVITTGGAGGRTDPTRVEVIDLSRTVQDVLASKVRARLRKDYGFPREPKKKFGIDCVFSQEPIQQPMRQPSRPTATVPGDTAAHKFCATPVDGGAGLACAGYGSSVAVTATFGFAAAARTIDHLLKVKP